MIFVFLPTRFVVVCRFPIVFVVSPENPCEFHHFTCGMSGFFVLFLIIFMTPFPRRRDTLTLPYATPRLSSCYFFITRASTDKVGRPLVLLFFLFSLKAPKSLSRPTTTT